MSKRVRPSDIPRNSEDNYPELNRIKAGAATTGAVVLGSAFVSIGVVAILSAIAFIIVVFCGIGVGIASL